MRGCQRRSFIVIVPKGGFRFLRKRVVDTRLTRRVRVKTRHHVRRQGAMALGSTLEQPHGANVQSYRAGGCKLFGIHDDREASSAKSVLPAWKETRATTDFAVFFYRVEGCIGTAKIYRHILCASGVATDQSFPRDWLLCGEQTRLLRPCKNASLLPMFFAPIDCQHRYSNTPILA